MKLKPNLFTQALKEKRSQVGLWVSLSHHFSAEVIATSDFDWALLDMEHSPNSIDAVLGQMQAFAPSTTTAIVRPQWNDAVLVKRLLDIGAEGLLFPMIQSVEEAKSAVASTRYPPHGIRGVSGSTRANAFGRITDYFSRVEEETTVLLQLETRKALASATEIASVDGVNGIFFGPADIAADIGLLGNPMADEVWETIMPVARKLIDLGVPVGTLVLDANFAANLIKEGFTFVACGSDISLLSKGADKLVSDVRSAI
ncbi:MAG: 4-hydroxy-2-oxo-heptane-1,7-dioate aldolase [Gammaproteobacteria bacterium]|nr:4-hydroxy-2-oxo-heptane-1,7-dioate aldolase [Gammaproteobacteria bacterium]